MRKLFLFITALLFIACSKSDDDHDFKESLPEPSQKGAVMFACYVDGKAYIAKGYEGVTCFYQWVDGERQFSIHGNLDKRGLIVNVGIGGYYINLIEGLTYDLKEIKKHNVTGSILFSNDGVFAESSSTNSEYTGELIITKLDMENEIVSGTFWFDVKHPLTGERVEVRDGRFDTHFSQ